MGDQSLAEIAEKADEKHGAKPAYRVLYDGQCEICQACVSWLKALDHENKTICLPISADALSTVDARLNLDECLRQLHVVPSEGEIHVGWDAVACLARLFPSTWLIGAVGQRFPFRNVGRWLYGFVAKNRYSLSKCRGGACQVAKPEAVRRQAKLGAFWSCYTLGLFIRLPLVLWAGMRAAAHWGSFPSDRGNLVHCFFPSVSANNSSRISAAAQLLDDAVVRDGLADRGARKN